MEQNAPGIAKKIWQIVKVAFFMLKKGICKRKIILDLSMMMKSGKIAGKAALHNLMLHHNHQHHSTTAADAEYAAPATANPDEYEFSCSNTPLHRRYLNKMMKKSHHHKQSSSDADAVNKVLEMMMAASSVSDDDVPMASPDLPGLGYGRSPMTRQLRITDSPFPIQDSPAQDSRVDQAAEDFINKFYSQLKQQKLY